MRLIDADAEIAKLNDIIACELEVANEYQNHKGDSYLKYMYHSALGKVAQAKSKIRFLNLARTAYDVDKVVERLEQLILNNKSVNKTECENMECLSNDCIECMTLHAISIVKGAVKE